LIFSSSLLSPIRRSNHLRKSFFQRYCLLFRQCPLNSLAKVSDRIWTLVKLAQVARMQQLSTVCLCTLAKLSSEGGLDSDSAFERLREQIRVGVIVPLPFISVSLS
jgi:hypothetical protein